MAAARGGADYTYTGPGTTTAISATPSNTSVYCAGDPALWGNLAELYPHETRQPARVRLSIRVAGTLAQ